MSNSLRNHSSDHQSLPVHIPGYKDFWVLIFLEMVTFGVFFVTFMVYRAQNVEMFNTSQLTLNINMGLLNTVILLTSSWAIVQAVESARKNNTSAARHYIIATILCAVSFGVVKFFEYSDKFHHGITLSTNLFYIFYFMLTIIHLFHVVIGTAILTYACKNIRQYGSGNIKFIESGASFWHMVDGFSYLHYFMF